MRICQHEAMRHRLLAGIALVTTTGVAASVFGSKAARHAKASAPALDVRSVEWSSVIVPPVCGGSRPIRIHRPAWALRSAEGTAQLRGLRPSVEVDAGWGRLVYGDLSGHGLEDTAARASLSQRSQAAAELASGRTVAGCHRAIESMKITAVNAASVPIVRVQRRALPELARFSTTISASCPSVVSIVVPVDARGFSRRVRATHKVPSSTQAAAPIHSHDRTGMSASRVYFPALPTTSQS